MLSAIYMYLRSTKRKNKDGSVVEYYQLAHNVRHPKTGRSAAQIIHSFGRADKLDRDELVRLCRSIARVCGLVVTDPLKEDDQPKSETQTALESDFKIKKTLAFGCPLAIEALWDRLGLKKTLTDIVGQKGSRIPYERALFAMTANRLCEPESKLGVWDRWLSRVYLSSCNGLKLNHMYEAMDLLQEHSVEVEKNLFLQTADLFNLEVDLIFYDTTTASFHVDYEDDDPSDDNPNSLRKFGRGKEGDWAPQVVVALAVTRQGIPVRSWVLPGNTTDVATVKQVRSDLKGWKLGRALFVADAGMNSEDNRSELARACGKYLLACRMSSVAEIKRDVLSRPGRFSVIKDNLHAKEVIVGDGERRKRYILCYNPKEAERQARHRETIVSLLEQELDRHRDLSASAQWAIELLASRRFKRYLRITKAGQVRIDRAAVRNAAKYDGKWVLETNDDTISLEDAACGYKGLMVIERCFRSLKRTQIKMTPMYHWVARRIEAHVKICVMALAIERVAELSCGMPWSKIRRALEELQITELFNSNFRVLMRNELPSKTRNILKLLKIKVPKQVVELEKTAEK